MKLIYDDHKKTEHYREFGVAGGIVQVVRLLTSDDGECVVGYKPNATGIWAHWGLGEGGYAATVERFTNLQRCDRWRIQEGTSPRESLAWGRRGSSKAQR